MPEPHIKRIGEGASTAQRSDSPAQPFIQRFPKAASDTQPSSLELGRLYLVPTPIAAVAAETALPACTLAVARRLRHFVAENAKPTRGFLKAIGHPGPIAQVALTAIDPLPLALADAECWLSAGHDVGLASDAGMPAVADPGAAIVTAAHRMGARVVPLPGASSLLLALAASGLDGQRFEFLGYLPAKPAERDRAIREAVGRLHSTGATQIFIETPYRHAPLLAALCQLVPGDVALAVAQDLTGEHERIVSKPRAEWTPADRALFAEKRPAVFLLGRGTRLPAIPRL